MDIDQIAAIELALVIFGGVAGFYFYRPVVKARYRAQLRADREARRAETSRKSASPQ